MHWAGRPEGLLLPFILKPDGQCAWTCEFPITGVQRPQQLQFHPTFSMASAVLTGTVLFSTTILLRVETEAIMRAAPSQ